MSMRLPKDFNSKELFESFRKAEEEKRKYMDVWHASDTLLKTFTEVMEATYKVGLDDGKEELKGIHREVFMDIIAEELEKNPNITLKNFAKKHKFLKDSEK